MKKIDPRLQQALDEQAAQAAQALTVVRIKAIDGMEVNVTCAQVSIDRAGKATMLPSPYLPQLWCTPVTQKCIA